MALVYIVEDDRNIREIETFALRNTGYEVMGFECAKDFYKEMENRKPDIILLDIMLPDEDGLEIVRKLPDSDITIETDPSCKTTITCEKSRFNIIGKSGEDFSYLPVVEKEDSIVISQFTLKEMVRQTIFSISDNDNNKLMTGELFEINGDELKLVSSDGHRISIRKIQLREMYEHKKVIVPGKTLNEVSKILPGGADNDLTIYFTSNHIVFEFENTVVVSRLIEGEYFNIDRMLSSDYETKIKVNKKEKYRSQHRQHQPHNHAGHNSGKGNTALMPVLLHASSCMHWGICPHIF